MLLEATTSAFKSLLVCSCSCSGLFYVCILAGFKIDSIQNDVFEEIITCDEYKPDYNINDTVCGIGDNFTAGRVCNVTFTTPRDLYPPILIHYGIQNFHQNHRSYYRSKDPYQLLGRVGGQDAISAEDCQPLNTLGNVTINPCGLIANTLFDDIFELIDDDNSVDIYGESLQMLETGIAWQSDIEYMFAQPDGFEYSECTLPKLDNGTCDPACCGDGECGNKRVPYQDKDDEDKCYRFYYPQDDTTQYLYETYPEIISPIEGVMNEHFIVWMRIATQPDFRKLYGWINQPIAANTNLTFQITSNYVVTRFQGSKTLILSTTSIFGGKNPYLAPVFIWVGVFCLVAGSFFALKTALRPRKLADPAYLHFKEE